MKKGPMSKTLQSQTTHSFHISGTHCPACKIYIEDTLSEQDGVKHAQVDLKQELLHITVEKKQEATALARTLTTYLQSNGYTVSVEKSTAKIDHTSEFWTALPIGVAILLLFFLLQKSGILNIGFGGQVSPITGFMIGLVASVSSCLAIVGGLILSLSAQIAKDGRGDPKKSIIVFHVGRVVGFAVLGGVLGLIGGVVGVNFTFSAILGIIASTVMLVLGLNLIGLLSKNAITIPSTIYTSLRKIQRTNYAPLTLGFATFFLPCGFTQSMQVSALSSGSFLTGLLIMTAFAIGTLPMLALVSFGSTSFSQGKYAGVFMKTAGIIVIGLGLFSLLSGFASLGIISPLFTI